MIQIFNQQKSEKIDTLQNFVWPLDQIISLKKNTTKNYTPRETKKNLEAEVHDGIHLQFPENQSNLTNKKRCDFGVNWGGLKKGDVFFMLGPYAHQSLLQVVLE